MCLAIEQMKEASKLEGKLEGERKGRLEGRLESAVKTCRKLGMKREAVADYISEEFDKTADEAEVILTQYWK